MDAERLMGESGMVWERKQGGGYKVRWMLLEIVILEYYKEFCTEIAYNNIVLYAKPPFYLRCINTGMNSRPQ